uniref:Uncharacterized protein n=1 Tax=Anguilla anguilla TaxID=7936 RepID=A0A0E9SCY8_ANGAN
MLSSPLPYAIVVFPIDFHANVILDTVCVNIKKFRCLVCPTNHPLSNSLLMERC